MKLSMNPSLQFLPHDRIEELLRSGRHRTSVEIVDSLMAEVTALNDPDQDNVSIGVVKLNKQ